MTLHQANWDALPWEQVREGVARKAFSGEGATLSLNRLDPGHTPRPHDHPHEQMVYILQGTIDFHIEGEVVRLGPGGMLVIPPNAHHWGEVVGEEKSPRFDMEKARTFGKIIKGIADGGS